MGICDACGGEINTAVNSLSEEQKKQLENYMNESKNIGLLPNEVTFCSILYWAYIEDFLTKSKNEFKKLDKTNKGKLSIDDTKVFVNEQLEKDPNFKSLSKDQKAQQCEKLNKKYFNLADKNKNNKLTSFEFPKFYMLFSLRKVIDEGIQKYQIENVQQTLTKINSQSLLLINAVDPNTIKYIYQNNNIQSLQGPSAQKIYHTGVTNIGQNAAADYLPLLAITDKNIFEYIKGNKTIKDIKCDPMNISENYKNIHSIKNMSDDINDIYEGIYYE